MTHIHPTWLVTFMTRIVRDACVGDMTHVTCYAWRHGACPYDRTHVFHDACYAWKTRHDARLKNIGHAVFFKSHVWKTRVVMRQDSSFSDMTHARLSDMKHVWKTWVMSRFLWVKSEKHVSWRRHDSCFWDMTHASLSGMKVFQTFQTCVMTPRLSGMTYVVETCLMLCMKNAMCCSDVTHVHQTWFIMKNAKWLVSFRHETCFSTTTCVFHHAACTQKERRRSKIQK